MKQLLPCVLQAVRLPWLLPNATKLLRPSRHFDSPSFNYFYGRKYSLKEIASSSVLSNKTSFHHLSTSCLNDKLSASRPGGMLHYPVSSLAADKKRDVQFGIQRRYLSEDRETTALTVWSNLKEIKSSPVPALAYGFSGLIPFISVPVYMTMSQTYLPQVAFAQLAYGAAILSFLGGVRWGFVLPEESAHNPDWFNLGYSVTPALVAWMGLLLPDPISVFTVMAGLAGAAYFDTAIPGYPPWFKGLRFVLSIVAVISLWTTFMCRFFLRSGKDSALNENQKKD